MSKEQPLWQTDFIVMLRWISFLPIGFILTATLQVIPSLAVGLVKANLPDSTFLLIVGAVLAIPIFIVLGWAWCMTVLMTPHLSCRVIAPGNGAPAIIYGMLFCLFEGTFLVSILKGGTPWIPLAYQLIFLGIGLGGMVMLYKEIELTRITRWILHRRTLKHVNYQI